MLKPGQHVFKHVIISSISCGKAFQIAQSWGCPRPWLKIAYHHLTIKSAPPVLTHPNNMYNVELCHMEPDSTQADSDGESLAPWMQV